MCCIFLQFGYCSFLEMNNLKGERERARAAVNSEVQRVAAREKSIIQIAKEWFMNHEKVWIIPSQSPPLPSLDTTFRVNRQTNRMG